jgi:hypothetical protein
VLLLEVKQSPIGDDPGSELGPGDSRTLKRDLNRAPNDAKLATLSNGRFETLRQADPDRRGFWRLEDAHRLIAFQADRKVQRCERGEFGLGRRVHGLKGFRVLNLRPQDDFALNNAFPLPLTSINKLFLAAVEGILRSPP